MRVSLFVAAMLSAFLWSGCGGEDNPSGGGNGGGDNNGGGGGTYDFVELGGLKWMKKNLNIKTADSRCYDNADSNCVKYGRLYTWNSAKTVCPSGWRLPDTSDWNRLVEEAGGKNEAGVKLKSTSGWDNKSDGSSGNGTDEFRFSALPAGEGTGESEYVTFNYIGFSGSWWSGPERPNSMKRDGFYMQLMKSGNIGFGYGSNVVVWNSVRCVK